MGSAGFPVRLLPRLQFPVRGLLLPDGRVSFYCSDTAPAGASRATAPTPHTRRTGGRTNTNDGEDGGSLSAGIGSPTLGYKSNPTVRYCSYAILLALLAYLVAALLNTICSSSAVVLLNTICSATAAPSRGLLLPDGRAPTPHLQELPGATSSATWWTRGGLVAAPTPPTEKMVAHCPRVPAVPP